MPADVRDDLARGPRSVEEEREDLHPRGVRKPGEEPREHLGVPMRARAEATGGGWHVSTISDTLVEVNITAEGGAVRSIGSGVTLAMAAVGICCGVALLLGAVGAGTLGLGFARSGLIAVGVAFAVLGVVLLAIRRARQGGTHVR